MALCTAVDITHIDEIRQRLRVDINDSLYDIRQKIKDERAAMERRSINRKLNKWFIGLFSGDHEEAKRALTKCISLTPPHKEVTPEEMTNLLPVLWSSCEALFDGDYSSLMEEIDRNLEKSGIKPV